jgi:TatD DNase family protein
MRFFDTHCHLAGDELKPTALELAARAQERGIQAMAIIAADMPSLLAAPDVARDIAAARPGLRTVYTAGLHPHEAETIAEHEWAEVLRLAPGAAAIGETGLDYYYDHSPRDVQRGIFARHIELAGALKKPLVIHCRQAKDEVLELLRVPAIKNHPNPGILHCFTEDVPMARSLLDLGFYISFSGIVSFRNAEVLREVAREVPLDRLLIETDSPWLAPIPHRGKRNEPAFVADVFEAIKTLRKEPPEELAAALWRNSLRVFGMSEEDVA